MKYFLVAGEASGDLHASNLMRAILRLDPQASFMYTGGDAMAEVAGTAPLVHYREMAYMGFVQILLHMSQIRAIATKVQQAMLTFSPDVVIPVDYGGFNLRYILPFAHSQHFYVAYYIVPKVWAWRRHRLKSLARYTDLGLCILPFEPKVFTPHNLSVTYVGNPCMDALSTCLEAPRPTLSDLGLDPTDERPIVALLAGSRKQELKENLPVMLKVAERYPHIHFVLAGAPGLSSSDYASYLRETSVSLIFGKTYPLLRVARAALVTSGTATLETALLGCPQVVCYRFVGLRAANWIFDYLFPIRYFSLVNLIMDRPVVRELLSADCTPETVARELDLLLPDTPERNRMLGEYDQLKQKIGAPGCSDRAAAEIIRNMKAYKVV